MAISSEARTRRSSWRLFAVALSLLSLAVTLTLSRCSRLKEEPEEPKTAATTFICEACKSVGPQMKRCSRCKKVCYCSTDCQRKHWSVHKRECRPSPAISPERALAETVLRAQNERLGGSSPMTMLALDPFLARDLIRLATGPLPPTEVWMWNAARPMSTVDEMAFRTLQNGFVCLQGRRINGLAYREHMLAIVDDEVWSAGIFNRDGVLGRDAESLEDMRLLARVPAFRGNKVVSVACGCLMSFVVLDNGDLYAWGAFMGGTVSVFGRHWPPRRVLVPTTARVVSVVSGAHVAAALDALGGIFIWGNDLHIPCGDAPTQVPELESEFVVSVAFGHDHIAVLTQSGIVYTWGNNREKQLGRLTDANTPKPLIFDAPVDMVACSCRGTLVVLRDGGVVVWGYGQNAPWRVPFFDDKQVAHVYGAEDVFDIILDSGELYIWGDIWTGDSLVIPSKLDPVKIPGFENMHVTSAVHGSNGVYGGGLVAGRIRRP